jgi:hypothetical protein
MDDEVAKQPMEPPITCLGLGVDPQSPPWIEYSLSREIYLSTLRDAPADRAPILTYQARALGPALDAEDFLDWFLEILETI